MRSVVGPSIGVKAAGGIRTLEDLEAMTAAGATRIGASASVKIVGGGRCLIRRVRKRRNGPGSAARRAPVRFHERAELLDFLLDVSAATSRNAGPRSHPGQRGAIVKEVVTYDLFAICCTASGGGLASVIPSAIAKRWFAISSSPLGEGITGLAASTQQPIMVGDVRSDPRYLTALDVVRSELAVPMVARGKLVGVIDLQSTRLNAYREADRALLQLIASRVGVSIDNARLYRRADRQNRTLKTLARPLAGIQLHSGSG